MAVQISRREVFNNIIRFKDSLHDKRGEHKRGKERSYPVLLNRKTGDIRFAQKIESIEPHLSKNEDDSINEWQPIQIDVQEKNGEVRFAIHDPSHHNLKPDGLEPIAFRVISETLEALNRIAHLHKLPLGHTLPEEALLHDLSDLHLAPLAPRIDDLPGWLGSLSRLDAEKMLFSRPEGTYLLRRGDGETEAIAFHLSSENKTDVRVYVCTVIEPRDKISDILFLATIWGWTLYKDNPWLSCPIYRYQSSPHSLLIELGHRLKHPIS